METTKVEIHQHYSPKPQGTKRLFDNPFLERLTRTHISIPLIMFYGFSAFLLYRSAVIGALTGLEIVGMFLAGFIFFTLVEYMMHRFLYHMLPHTSINKNIQYKLHGVHHEYPKDKERLAMPPVISIVLTALFYFLFVSILGEGGKPFDAGFMTGYASYLCVHYAVHAFKPPKNIFKSWWINHSIHHYQNDEIAFGVTSPFWDYVFGTMPKKKK